MKFTDSRFLNIYPYSA
jgi:hypothetical protein